MKAVLGLFMVAALAAAPGKAEPVVRAGVVAKFYGQIMLAMSGPLLAAGTRLTLVAPDAPQRVQKALVRRWSGMVDLNVRTPGPYYFIDSDTEGQPLPELAVAVLGDPPVNRMADTVSLHMDETLPDVRVRACRSMEGIYLTLWSGEPLKAPRLWHLYYYVGHDLQQTCLPEDTGNGGG